MASMKRRHVHCFPPSEKLYRNISTGHLDGPDHIKADALQFQVSVCREKFDPHARSFSPPRFNGRAVIAVESARIVAGQAFSVVVDEPSEHLPAHALIAIGTTETDEVQANADAKAIKDTIANRMRVHRKPV